MSPPSSERTTVLLELIRKLLGRPTAEERAVC